MFSILNADVWKCSCIWYMSLHVLIMNFNMLCSWQIYWGCAWIRVDILTSGTELLNWLSWEGARIVESWMCITDKHRYLAFQYLHSSPNSTLSSSPSSHSGAFDPKGITFVVITTGCLGSIPKRILYLFFKLEFHRWVQIRKIMVNTVTNENSIISIRGIFSFLSTLSMGISSKLMTSIACSSACFWKYSQGKQSTVEELRRTM